MLYYILIAQNLLTADSPFTGPCTIKHTKTNPIRRPWGSDFTGDILLREREVQTLYSPPLSGPFAIERPVSCFCEGEEKQTFLCSAHSPETHLSLFAFGWAQEVILCNPYLGRSHALVRCGVHVKKWNLPGDLHKFVTRVYCSIGSCNLMQLTFSSSFSSYSF